MGLKWELQRQPQGWTLGTISLHGKPIERPITDGLLGLRSHSRAKVRWLAPAERKQLDPQTVRFIGQDKVGGATFSYTVTIAVCKDLPAACWTTSWTVDKDVDDWQVYFAYHQQFQHDWRVQSYPWAGNTESINLWRMRYCGVPGVLVYRPDQSVVALFAIDSNSDYLNPTTWRGDVAFHFADRHEPPQYRVGDLHLKAGIRYEMPLQLILSDAGGFVGAMTSIVPAWIKLNHYRVDNSLHVRTPQQAFEIAVEGRRQMKIWKPGIGYHHNPMTPFVYVGNNPYIAWFEYRLYEITSDRLWRDRAFRQIDVCLKAQQPSGVFHTSWYFQRSQRPNGAVAEGFCSWDWGHNGYKVDINAWMDRYILQTWQRVKEREGIDRQDWYRAAMASLEWVRSHQNADGGLAQCVDIETGERSISAVCGRALVGLPIIAQITGDQRYWQLSADLERFLRRNVEGRFWYTGMHPDLPPGDFEQDSVYAVVEYWLNKYDRTGDKECLDRAAANAYYGLLYWCPKQLTWVKSPTQCAQRAAALQPVFGLLLRQSQDPMPRPFGETHWQPVIRTSPGPCDATELLRPDRRRPVSGCADRGDRRSVAGWQGRIRVAGNSLHQRAGLRPYAATARSGARAETVESCQGAWIA